MSASKDIQALVSTVGSKVATLLVRVDALQSNVAALTESNDALAAKVTELLAAQVDQADVDAQAATTAELNDILARLG